MSSFRLPPPRLLESTLRKSASKVIESHNRGITKTHKNGPFRSSASASPKGQDACCVQREHLRGAFSSTEFGRAREDPRCASGTLHGVPSEATAIRRRRAVPVKRAPPISTAKSVRELLRLAGGRSSAKEAGSRNVGNDGKARLVSSQRMFNGGGLLAAPTYRAGKMIPVICIYGVYIWRANFGRG